MEGGRGRGRSRSVSDLPGPQQHACVDHACWVAPPHAVPCVARVAPILRPRPIHRRPLRTHRATAHPPTAAPPQPRARARLRPAPAPAPFAFQRQPTHQPPPRAVTCPRPSRFKPHLTTTTATRPDPAGIFGSPSPLLTGIVLRLTETCNVHAATAPPQRNETKASERRHRPATREEEVSLESAHVKTRRGRRHCTEPLHSAE